MTEGTTIPALLDRRVDDDADGPYLDICGTPVTAGEVQGASARIAVGLTSLGVGAGDRVATLLDTGVEAVLGWFGTIRAGAVSVPVNTAFKGDYLLHQLRDCGARVVVADAAYLDRLGAVVASAPELRHVVVVGEVRDVGRAQVHGWQVLADADAGGAPAADPDPGDVAMFVYTGGTTGPAKGCMVSHNYTASLARQVNTCWRRTADDVPWVPLPLFHFNAYTTTIVSTLLSGGRGALHGRFSVSGFWPEVNRVGATISVSLGSMAHMLAHDVDRPEMPRSGAPEANTTLRLMTAAPLPPDIDTRLRKRFDVETFSGGYGLTEASLLSWQPPGVLNKPGAAGVVNDESFDVRIFDDDDAEVPAGTAGEIVVRPKRPHVMFEGYWGNPAATVAVSRNWWFHTGDIGRVDDEGYLYFVDRQKDYLRRRGENVSSQQLEAILLKRGDLAEVAVHAVPSDVLEDDIKVTAVRRPDATVTEEELFRWCIDELPYFALPRFVEFRTELPHSPVGRVLKRDLRAEAVTPSTWDASAAGIDYERR